MGRRKKEETAVIIPSEEIETEEQTLEYEAEEKIDKIRSKETIIVYNEFDDFVSIETQDRVLFEHIEKNLKIKPYDKLDHARLFKFPKKYLQLPKITE